MFVFCGTSSHKERALTTLQPQPQERFSLISPHTHPSPLMRFFLQPRAVMSQRWNSMLEPPCGQSPFSCRSKPCRFCLVLWATVVPPYLLRLGHSHTASLFSVSTHCAALSPWFLLVELGGLVEAILSSSCVSESYPTEGQGSNPCLSKFPCRFPQLWPIHLSATLTPSSRRHGNTFSLAL